MADTPLLEIRDLRVMYGAVEALKGVSMIVNEGEIVTLIGSNGAGKSTLLKSISGMVRPKSGQILFRGESLSENPRDVLRVGISHVPEGRGIFGNLTVHENLLLGAYLRRDRKRVETPAPIRGGPPARCGPPACGPATCCRTASAFI